MDRWKNAWMLCIISLLCDAMPFRPGAGGDLVALKGPEPKPSEAMASLVAKFARFPPDVRRIGTPPQG